MPRSKCRSPSPQSGDADHDVGRLDNGVDLVADLEAKISTASLVMDAVTMVPLTSAV
jgi:hypothetical protein